MLYNKLLIAKVLKYATRPVWAPWVYCTLINLWILALYKWLPVYLTSHSLFLTYLLL